MSQGLRLGNGMHAAAWAAELCRWPTQTLALRHVKGGLKMGALAHDGGHLVIVVIGLLAVAVLMAVAWFRNR